jgi:uncharacterized protein YqhQ
MYFPNKRFIPQAMVTLFLTLPILSLYYEGYYGVMILYFVGVVYVLTNAVSNLRFPSENKEKDKNLNISLRKRQVMSKNLYMEDIKGGLNLWTLLLDGLILSTLIPSFRSLSTTIAANGSAMEIALSALLPTIIIVGFVYVVGRQAGIIKGKGF